MASIADDTDQSALSRAAAGGRSETRFLEEFAQLERIRTDLSERPGHLDVPKKPSNLTTEVVDALVDGLAQKSVRLGYVYAVLARYAASAEEAKAALESRQAEIQNKDREIASKSNEIQRLQERLLECEATLGELKIALSSRPNGWFLAEPLRWLKQRVWGSAKSDLTK